MKKTLSLIVLSTLIATTNAMAIDYIEGGYYGGLGVGWEDFSGYSSYDSGTTLVINGGKPITVLGPGTIGVEGEFTYTISPLEYNSRYHNDELTITTFGAYATYTYDFTDAIFARGKLGIVYHDYSHDGSYNYADHNYTTYHPLYRGSSNVNLAFGIGAGYRFNNKFNIFSDFIMLDSLDLKQLNLGLQFHF